MMDSTSTATAERVETEESNDAPENRRGAVDHVFEHIRDGILGGYYVPGQRLIEADVTRELKVSRGPVREAFRRLSAEGLLETIPNRGAQVRRFSRREMLELFQIRGSLEVLAARLAAERCRDNKVRSIFESEIAPIWRDVPRSPGQDYIRENNQFHDAIVVASGNEQLLKLIRQQRLPMIMYQLYGSITLESIAASLHEHRLVATAILDGKPADASAAMAAHLERASHVAEKMSPRHFQQD